MQESKSSVARFGPGASELRAPRAAIDVREEIANAPVGPYHLFLAVLIGMVVFFDGYDTFNPAYVIHYVMKPWHLAPGQAGLIVSSGLIGFMIGALLQGYRVAEVPTVMRQRMSGGAPQVMPTEW